MAKRKPSTNPFYIVLLISGVIFAVTACAYCAMAFRAVASSQGGEVSASGEGLMHFLDRYGFWLMLSEIIVLAVATVGAITTDRYWTNRGNRKAEKS